MAPRPNWKGYLKLALVTCPVAMFTAATTAERISFHTLNRETGNRVRRQYIDAETGDVVEDDEQVKGYELEDGQYVQIEEDEYDSVALESTHTIDIDKFVPRAEVDEIYIDTPYYLVPTDKVGEEAFVVIREAMRARRMVGLARVVLYRRERILMLEPRSKGIMAHTLHYDTEVRDDRGYFEDIRNIKLSSDLIDLASHIIDTKASRFDPSEFRDRYEEALVEMVKAKAKGKKPKAPPKPRDQGNVVNLMEALRRSLGATNDNEDQKPAAPSRAKSATKAKSSSSGSSTTAKKKAPSKPTTRKAG
ncbi:MAG TPA: Ku protein [Geminicoccus sp.]|jgi:DNA end-binding protein Ku|uniref:non-homologous end joining protein Ku n=1 Tax=Geminicoccus sp. TaxID=2024832 RepID=UPI002E318827|nr:Ku protein [Geminicoccus sp.]HEX2529646.1 Ku protein [Geminicoccus sp.]